MILWQGLLPLMRHGLKVIIQVSYKFSPIAVAWATTVSFNITKVYNLKLCERYLYIHRKPTKVNAALED